MDTLILKECRFECVIGVFPEERGETQPIVIDAELALDIRKAAENDKMEDAVDYRAVHDLMKEYAENGKYFLFETLAEKLAEAILEKFPVEAVTLTVKKPKPMEKRNGAWAGVKITRTREAV
jgi:7,8-dihydroneopterin aldolase/epimerase/oxygenase